MIPGPRHSCRLGTDRKPPRR